VAKKLSDDEKTDRIGPKDTVVILLVIFIVFIPFVSGTLYPDSLLVRVLFSNYRFIIFYAITMGSLHMCLVFLEGRQNNK